MYDKEYLNDQQFEKYELRTPEHMGFTRTYDHETHTRWEHPCKCVATVLKRGRWWCYWLTNGLVQTGGKGYKTRAGAYNGLLFALKAKSGNKEFFPNVS